MVMMVSGDDGRMETAVATLLVVGMHDTTVVVAARSPWGNMVGGERRW